MTITISKTYSRTVLTSRGYEKFVTILSEVFEVKSAEELASANAKLFAQAKGYTEVDIESTLQEIEDERRVAKEGE